MLHARYLKNHSADTATWGELPANQPRPDFPNKPAFREWCNSADTDHVFYSLNEGSTPGERIKSNDPESGNPIRVCYGLVADYDSPVDWETLDDRCRTATITPTWRSRTFSGYVRLVWVFDKPILVHPKVFERFIRKVAEDVGALSLIGHLDPASFKSNQYFEVGTDWEQLGEVVEQKLVQSAFFEISKKADTELVSGDTHIPLESVAEEVERRWPGRWVSAFDVGSRGPLFWVSDGIDREGCRVCPDGMLCFSDRAAKPFMSWRDLLGKKFVNQFAQEKASNLLDNYFHDGKQYFKLGQDGPRARTRDLMVIDLKKMGFAAKVKKGDAVSEVEEALAQVADINQIDIVAPVIFDKRRVVRHHGTRILNNQCVVPTHPAASGGPEEFAFLHKWLEQLFVAGADGRPSVQYFYAWLQRFYRSILERTPAQGHALVLVGPTGRGKTLLSNVVIGRLVGGHADASDYLAGRTQFNKDLGKVPEWTIDDTTSTASFSDHQRATELIKRAVANPKLEYQAKFVDTCSLPWTGRVVMSLNMDPHSLAVIPTLDSSNRDKIMALRVSEDSTQKFLPNHELESIIERELPHFGKWLLDTWETPAEITGDSRFGVQSYIDPAIANAAYDNSSRSTVAELVEFFCKNYRRSDETAKVWTGTLTEFQSMIQAFNNGRNLSISGNTEQLRRAMGVMEEQASNNENVRPITSMGSGGGKIWIVNLEAQFDIDALIHQGNQKVA